MLVRDDGEGALVIGQQSHAWLSGQLARAWGNERFPAPDPREPIALGAEQHDVGWALADLEPRLDDASGLPRSFLQSSVEEHLAIWRAAPDHLLSQSLYAALVVSLHGRALSEHRAERTPALAAQLQPHIDAERARQAQSMLGTGDLGVRRGDGRPADVGMGRSLAGALQRLGSVHGKGRSGGRGTRRLGAARTRRRDGFDRAVAVLAASSSRSAARRGGCRRATATRRR